MEVQDNMKERLLTMCQRMARRKSAGQKKRTLLQLSEMLGTLGYRTTLIGKKGIHGQQLIGGDPEHARLIVAADFNLREARMIPGRQRLLDQSANRKNQLDNLTVTLVLSVLLAVMGVLHRGNQGGRPLVLVFNGSAGFPVRFRTGPQTGSGQCRKECGVVCDAGMRPYLPKPADRVLFPGRNRNGAGFAAAARAFPAGEAGLFESAGPGKSALRYPERKGSEAAGALRTRVAGNHGTGGRGTG